MADEKVHSAAVEAGSIADRLRLFDDTLMAMFFKDNIPAMELVLRIILENEGIEVLKVTVQDETKSPLPDGRSVCFDVTAQDGQGRFFDVEVQRSDTGAVPQRARYHADMLDMRAVKAGEAHFAIIAEGLRHFKEEEGRKQMCKLIEDYAQKSKIIGVVEMEVDVGLSRDDIVSRLMKKFSLTEEDAMRYYYLYSNASAV